MLQDKTTLRSSISERSFIVRRGIFELLPVLSVISREWFKICCDFFSETKVKVLFRFEKKSIEYKDFQTSFYPLWENNKKWKFHTVPFRRRLERLLPKLHFWWRNMAFLKNRLFLRYEYLLVFFNFYYYFRCKHWSKNWNKFNVQVQLICSNPAKKIKRMTKS